MDKHSKDGQEKENAKPKIYGDPEYPASEDIYSRAKKTGSAESEDNRKIVKGKLPGEDLDVPGSELDDKDEKIGEEDEENNYYSIGGEDHDDLEEDKAE